MSLPHLSQEAKAVVGVKANPAVHPLVVTDPHIRKLLQLAALRFMVNRARETEHATIKIGLALRNGNVTAEAVDAFLEEQGALDLAYPEHIKCDSM